MNPLNIGICGNIASGKTTHVKNNGLACIPIYENYASNPFLKLFYTNAIEYSFETEISFCLLHYVTIKEAKKKGQSFICDFSLILDRAFADVTLTEKRHRVFGEVMDLLESEVGLPDKLLHIQCPIDILLQRIKSRGRPFEQGITREYLLSLNDAIERQIENYSTRLHVEVVNTATDIEIKRNPSFNSFENTHLL